ncbi:hypothetical protein TNCV_462291 [Trichonephila clavipes]|uniref:Uncharacterized protein n=1 Tax=Trichonephila clavipes TaxID=2585209 RepID=A0A8X6UYK0_TRICX|nr:hypothetical protein TNCV_462291 [Trichonephila clavipes]
MPVVSAPCSCQPDCLVCGRRDVPPHNCAIHWDGTIMGWLLPAIGIDGVSRTNVVRRAHRSKIGGNFTEWKGIFTSSHAYDGPK